MRDTVDPRPDDRKLSPGQRIDALERALAARTELLATVSHELRTPMGAVISMADLLRGTSLNATQRHYVDTLRQSAHGLVSILNDILDHTKLETGRFELSPSDFSADALLRAVADANAARCADKGIDLNVTMASTLPPALNGDQGRIRQVLNNLIDNAIKFTDQGTITLNLDHRASKDGGAILKFAVEDTGIGISADTRAKLFRPFSQADALTARDYGGTGLGLSISAMLVALMGGRIECDSAPGKGSRFSFTLPCAPASGTGAETTASLMRGGGDSPKGHILVVEDNKINAMLMTTFLDKFGHSHEVAGDGEKAVEAMKSGSYDLVLMDVQMPRMDGIAATAAIRAMGGPAAETPIVALTANVMHGDKEAYLAAGMDGYVSKPVMAAELYRTISAFLSGGRAGAAKSSEAG